LISTDSETVDFVSVYKVEESSREEVHIDCLINDFALAVKDVTDIFKTNHDAISAEGEELHLNVTGEISACKHTLETVCKELRILHGVGLGSPC
jgi:hypothetical protein